MFTGEQQGAVLFSFLLTFLLTFLLVTIIMDMTMTAKSEVKEFRLEDYVVPIEDQLAVGVAPHLTSPYRRFQSANVIDLVKYRQQRRQSQNTLDSGE